MASSPLRKTASTPWPTPMILWVLLMTKTQCSATSHGCETPCSTLAFKRHYTRQQSTTMIWVCLEFEICQMMVSIPQVKLQAALQLVDEWTKKRCFKLISTMCATWQALPHGAVLLASQRLFLSRILVTLKQCPVAGEVTLDMELKKHMSIGSANIWQAPMVCS